MTHDEPVPRSLARVCSLALALLTGCGGAPEPAPTPIETGRCPTTGVAVQVLGSSRTGGLPGRAGASYAVHVDGRVRLLVDLGTGALTRLGDAGAGVDALDAVLITRIGVGPTADLPAVLDAVRLAGRTRPLALVGPEGSAARPSLAVWIRQVFRDAYPELARLVEAGQPYRLAINDVTVNGGTPSLVFGDGEIEVHAIGVPHGNAPAIGYRVQVQGRQVGFTGDQRADDPRFLSLVRGVDLLVAHVSAAEDGQSTRYARPSLIGALSNAARAGRLVLGGVTTASLARREADLGLIEARYAGPVDLASDLDCIVVPPPAPASAAEPPPEAPTPPSGP